MSSPMINVMHLLTSFEVGGAESVALNLARVTDRSRFRTLACSLSGDGPMRARFEAQGVETRFVDAPSNPLTRHVVLARRLARRLREDGVHVLHCHNSLPAIYGSIAARMAGVKAVVFTRHSYISRRRSSLGFLLEKAVAPLISRYVAVSQGVLDEAVRLGCMKKDRATVIYNGVDLERYQARSEPSEKKDGPVEIVCVARLSPEKRHQDLLDAMRVLVDRELPVRLTLVGDGALREELEARTRSLDIGEHVRFLGTRADVAERLPEFDIFVLPSDFEGLPLTILEAMACRLPVVATDVGSVKEAVEDGRTGLLTPACAPGKLADALERLVRDAELRAAMGEAGRSRAERVFALNIVTAEHEKLYETLVREGESRHKLFQNPQARAPKPHVLLVCREKPCGTAALGCEVFREKSVLKQPLMRVLVLSDTFPNRLEPWRGPYNRRQIECLSRLCSVTVINPIPFPRVLTDGRMRELTKGRDNVIDGVAMWHPVFRYVPLLGRGRTWKGVLAAARRALKGGAAGEYDMILATFAYPHGAAARALSAEMGIPYAIKARGSDLHALPDDGARRERTAEAVRDAGALIAVSGNLARIAMDLGADSRRVHVLPNGIDVEAFSRKMSREQARKGLGYSAKEPILLFVGNLLPVKGLDVALRALAEVGQARLVVVGDGPMKQRLQGLAAGAGIAERVKFMGRLGREEVALWMNAADVLLLPSRNEGCPNVVLESLASGTPVVASAVGAVPDLLDESCGIAVPPDDPKALADALVGALSREWNRDAIRERVEGMSWEANAATLLNILNGALAPEFESERGVK